MTDSNDHLAPAESAIEWELRTINAVPNKGPFSGDPSPEIDDAWAELMQGINIKVLPSEMESLGFSSLELKDESGFVGGLSVYHELHCIVSVPRTYMLAVSCQSRASGQV